VAEVNELTGEAGTLRVQRAIPGGVQVLEISGPAVLAAAADAAVPRVPGMKDLLAAGKKPAEHLDLASLNVPARNAVLTVTSTSRPERKARKGQIIDTTDPAAAAVELVQALHGAGAL
jgi:electron transfer flavoprotein beta subunit